MSTGRRSATELVLQIGVGTSAHRRLSMAPPDYRRPLGFAQVAVTADVFGQRVGA